VSVFRGDETVAVDMIKGAKILSERLAARTRDGEAIEPISLVEPIGPNEDEDGGAVWQAVSQHTETDSRKP
jgi:hypothetical protein